MSAEQSTIHEGEINSKDGAETWSQEIKNCACGCPALESVGTCVYGRGENYVRLRRAIDRVGYNDTIVESLHLYFSVIPCGTLCTSDVSPGAGNDEPNDPMTRSKFRLDIDDI